MQFQGFRLIIYCGSTPSDLNVLALTLDLDYAVFLFMCSGVVLGLSANFAKIFLPNIHRMYSFIIHRHSAHTLT